MVISMDDTLGLSAAKTPVHVVLNCSSLTSKQGTSSVPWRRERGIGIIGLPSLRADLLGFWKDGLVHVNIDRRGSDDRLEKKKINQVDGFACYRWIWCTYPRWYVVPINIGTLGRDQARNTGDNAVCHAKALFYYAFV